MLDCCDQIYAENRDELPKTAEVIRRTGGSASQVNPVVQLWKANHERLAACEYINTNLLVALDKITGIHPGKPFA